MADSLKEKVDAEPNNAEAHFQYAVSLFEDEKFAECRDVLQSALKIPALDAENAKKFKMWIRKCKTHLPEDAPTVPKQEAEALSQPQPQPSAPVAPPPVVAPRPSAIRHEWFQSPAKITFSFYVKGRTREQVAVHVTPRSVEVCIELDEGKEYQHSFENFFGAIKVDSLSIDVRKPVVEVVVEKETMGVWPSLELAASATAVSAAAIPVPVPASQTVPPAEMKYPSSKGKDWSKVKLDVDEGKPEGDQALNNFFREIYAGASDETRRAMVKSFVESNGTVLSTNWAEVGKEKVKGEAPKGMVMEKPEF